MAEINRLKLWVLCSYHHDSGGVPEIHRVYDTREQGSEDLALASNTSHQGWSLLPAPFFGTVAGLTAKRLREIAAIPDDEIDTSDIPEAGSEFFTEGKWQRLRPSEVNGAGNLCRTCKHRDFDGKGMEAICAFNPLITRTAARKVCQGKLWEPQEAVE